VRGLLMAGLQQIDGVIEAFHDFGGGVHFGLTESS
jgi:hypothetical protein